LDQIKIDDNKNLIEEFLEPYLTNFRILKQKWQGNEITKNTEIVNNYLAEKFDSWMEKYLPSSPQEKANFQKALTNLGFEDPNKIKLKAGENLIDQLKENGVDLNEVNNRINMATIINPFSQENQYIPIRLKNGKELRLDVKQYAEDLAEYNQLQKNTDANAKDSSQSQQNELSGLLSLYGKHKFNQKFHQGEGGIPLSKEEKKSIENFQTNANVSDNKREETLKKFAERFGLTIPENKSQNISAQTENKATETIQPIESQQNAGHDHEKRTSPIKGILKKSPSRDSQEAQDPNETSRSGNRVKWADRVTTDDPKENLGGRC